MNIKTNLFTLLTFILFSSFLTSCQTKEELYPAQANAPTIQADDDCTLEDQQYFELEELDPALSGSDASYAFLLTTSVGFHLSDCVCAVAKYEIGFTSLPTEFLVKDENQNSIPYTVEGNLLAANRTIVIDPDLMYDSASEIHVFFQDARELETAGGLCVIDNFGGIDRTTPLDFLMFHQDPVVVNYQLNYATWVKDLIIPTAITHPY